MAQTIPEQRFKAIVLMLLACLANALMAMCVKLSSSQIPIGLVLLVRFALSWLVCCIVLLFRVNRPAALLAQLKTRRWVMQVCRAILGSMSLLAFFLATQRLSLATATVLMSTSPFFIPLIAYLWKGIRFYHRLWWAMIIGFVGIVIILHPGADIFSGPALLGLSAGVGSAIVIFMTRLLSYDEPTQRTLFYDFMIGTFFSGLIFITQGVELVWNQSTIVLLAAVGLLGYLYLYFSVACTRYAPVRLTGPFLYATTVFGLLIDALVWSRTPDLVSWLGIVCIMTAGVLMLWLFPHDRFQSQTISLTSSHQNA